MRGQHQQQREQQQEEVALYTVVRFVTVQSVDLDTSVNNTVERVVCAEDNHMLTDMVTHTIEQIDAIRLGSLEVLSLTTVNMEDIGILDLLHELFAELNGKHNAGSDNNNSLWAL